MPTQKNNKNKNQEANKRTTTGKTRATEMEAGTTSINRNNKNKR